MSTTENNSSNGTKNNRASGDLPRPSILLVLSIYLFFFDGPLVLVMIKMELRDGCQVLGWSGEAKCNVCVQLINATSTFLMTRPITGKQ